MLRIIIVFTHLLIALCLTTEAQQVIAQLDFERKDAKPMYYEYCPADGGLATLGPMSARSTRFIGINKYDAALQHQWVKQVFEQNGRRNIDFVTAIGSSIFVFVSEFFPREKVIKTFYFKYDLEGNRLVNGDILSVYPNQKKQKVDLQYVLSPNKKKLLCYKNLQSRKELEKILYYVFDESGDFLQNGEISLKYPDQKFSIRRIKVSNQGNIFILGKHYKENRVKGPRDFEYLMYRHDTQTETGKEVNIDLGTLYISDLAFKLDKFENIYLAGFYSKRGTDQITGTIFQKLNPENDVEINSTEEFGEEFLGKFLSSGQINRGRELKNFYLNNIILRSDGGVVLLAEKYYITYTNFRDIYGYWQERELYHYDDIIVTSISGNGQIEWHAVVDKRQAGENPNNLSYFSAIGSSSTYLIYEYKPQGGSINIYYNQVGIEGETSMRKPLLKDYRYSHDFYPRDCEQINNKEAIMVYYNKRSKTLSVARTLIE